MNTPKHHHLHKRHRFHVGHLQSLPALSLNRLLGMISETMMGIFFPIFVYQFFDDSFTAVLLWWVITYGTRLPMFFLGAKFFSKVGLIASMVVGTLAWIVYYGGAFMLEWGTPHIWFFAGSAIIAVSIRNALYWAPFHAEFAEATSASHRGKQVGLFQAAQHGISLIGPLIGGAVISQFSYSAAFVISIIIVTLSIIPLRWVKQVEAEYTYTWSQTWKELFSKERRPVTISMIADGVNGVVGFVIWPIFLYEVFDGNVLDVGIYSTVIVLVSMILQVVLGEWLDRMKKNNRGRLLRIGDDLYSLGWIFKALVDTVVGVFAASTFHRFSSVLLRTPYDTLMYEQAADAGHYLDEYTVLREIALTIGRFGTVVLLLITSSFLPIYFAFIVAGIASLGIRYILQAPKSNQPHTIR